MSKTIVTITSLVVMTIFLGLYCLFYYYFLNNNMRACMTHYRDYDYCKTIVGGNNEDN